jgi:hypothetical protein
MSSLCLYSKVFPNESDNSEDKPTTYSCHFIPPFLTPNMKTDKEEDFRILRVSRGT